MHTRRLSMLILGLWLGLTFAMLFVATQNFRGVDRLLELPHSEAAKSLKTLGQDNTRLLLRYQIAELNRFYFDWYGVAQITLAFSLAACLLFATNGNKFVLLLAGAAILVVIVEKSFLYPEITYLGRLLDFAPKDTALPERARFASFHMYFTMMEMLKLILVVILGGKVLIRQHVSRHSRSRMSRSDALDETLDMR